MASAPSSAIEGNYALHMKTSASTDYAEAQGSNINVTFLADKTYSLKVSVFVVSEGVGDPFSITFGMSSLPYANYNFGVRFTGSSSSPSNQVLFGNFGTGPVNWKLGTWYDLEFRLLNGSTIFYMNGTQIGSFSNMVLGGTLQGYSLSSSPIGEIYADAITVSEDGYVRYFDGFENGLSNLQVLRSGGATVDTAYFGKGMGLSATVISLVLGICCGELFEATRGSNFRIDGTIENATSLRAVTSAMITVEVSYDRGNSYSLIGSATSDQYGNFSVYWNPSKVGLAVLQAVYSGNCCFLGDIATTNGYISPAISKLSLSLSSSTSLLGFSVGISGFLSGIDSAAISNGIVLLEFTVPAATGWSTLTSATTGPDGNYQTTWLPQATGTFTVRASWAGNGIYEPTSITATLTSISDGSKYIFAVASNATVSSSVYNASAKILSFRIRGLIGENGYADVSLPKEFAVDGALLKVHINGTDTPFQMTQSGDTVRLRIAFIFRNSYDVEIFLAESPGPISSSQPFLLYIIGLAVAVAVAVPSLLKLRSSLRKAPSRDYPGRSALRSVASLLRLSF